MPSPSTVSAPTTGGGARIAYLVSEYPTLSHAFIENEVEALRSHGVEVHTFSVRPTSPKQHRSVRSQLEAKSTTVLLDRGRALDQLKGLAATPPTVRGLLAGSRTAAGRRAGGARARVWQGFYLAEAVLLLAEMRRRGLRHLHVHFANNGADIARLVIAMGLAQDGPDSGWRWTLSMHGPTEFEAVEAFDLPAKVRSADAVACISDFCRGQLMRHTEPLHWSKLGLVRMAVDVDKFADRSAARTARGAGPLRVLFVGRLVPEKGPSVLLDAVAELRQGPDPLPIHVRIVGAGPLNEDLAAQLRSQGTIDVVELVGPLGNEDLPEEYAWADVFCLPSFSEGVPVVLMEAMATGLPVVTSPIAGIPELVRDSVNGHLVPPGRADVLARVLRDLAAATPAQRAELGASGRRHVSAEFGAELNVERLRRTISV